MGKDKLARWAEIKTFGNVIQPEIGDVIGQDHALKGKWNRDFFKNDRPVILELGCGKGEYTLGLAARYSGNNFIGVDIKGARIWRGAKTAIEKNIQNAAFLRTRIEFINSFFAENEVDEIWITFPDPYPKRRDSNKRLVSPAFLNSYKMFLKINGIIHLKTDKGDLYNYLLDIAHRNNLEIIRSTGDLYSETYSKDILSIKTHYEKIFIGQKMKIKYLSFRLDKHKIITDAETKTK